MKDRPLRTGLGQSSCRRPRTGEALRHSGRPLIYSPKSSSNPPPTLGRQSTLVSRTMCLILHRHGLIKQLALSSSSDFFVGIQILRQNIVAALSLAADMISETDPSFSAHFWSLIQWLHLGPSSSPQSRPQNRNPKPAWAPHVFFPPHLDLYENAIKH